jgi:hypothetical protein
MGALLGVSDSAFRHRFPAREDGRRQTDAARTEAAVAAIIEQLDVPLLDARPVVEPAEAADVAVAPLSATLGALDAMLLLRRASQGELRALAGEASQRLGVPQADAERFFDAYEHVGGATSFLDFEPGETFDQSGALPVEERADRRVMVAADIVARMAQDALFRKSTHQILADWEQAVNGDQPFLISRSTDDMKRHLSWLDAVGYEASSLTLTVYRATDQQVVECASKVSRIQPSAKRPSRTAKIGSPTEFALSVGRTRKLPSGRDLHRVLFALACAARARLLPDTAGD